MVCSPTRQGQVAGERGGGGGEIHHSLGPQRQEAAHGEHTHSNKVGDALPNIIHKTAKEVSVPWESCA